MLQQRPARIITQAASETIAKIETPLPAPAQRIIKTESKSENTPQLAQKHKAVRDETTPQPAQSQTVVKKENTLRPPQNQSVVKTAIKDDSTPEPFQKHRVVKNDNTPSPFSLASHSRQHKPTAKPTPKPKSKATPQLEPKSSSRATPTPTRILKFGVPATAYKKEPSDNPPIPSTSSSVTPLSSTTKRAFIDLSNDTSSDDDDDETPSKAPRMG